MRIQNISRRYSISFDIFLEYIAEGAVASIVILIILIILIICVTITLGIDIIQPFITVTTGTILSAFGQRAFGHRRRVGGRDSGVRQQP
jgi:hypothetical protein